MPQSEVNAPVHLQDRKIKENLDYTVLNNKHFVFYFKLPNEKSPSVTGQAFK